MISLDALVPTPTVSDSQRKRFYHLDLSELEDVELIDELNFLRPLLWGLDSLHWLRQRVAKLESEITKRRGNTSHEYRRRPRPKPAKGVKLE
jgi:hypothetical protein